MAPFNKRQIGYIQAVAGRQQHTTLRAGQLDRQLKSTDTAGTSDKGAAFFARPVNKLYNVRKARGGMVHTESTDDDAKQLLVHTWQLDRAPLAFDSRIEHNNNTLTPSDFSNLRGCWVGMGQHTDLDVFNSPCATAYATTDAAGGVSLNENAPYTTTSAGRISKFDLNQDQLSSTVRASPDGYLHSTNVTFRFTLPTATPGTGAVSSLLPTAEDLGLNNTDSTQGLTVDQYNDFTKGGTNAQISPSISALLDQYRSRHPMGQDHYEFRWIVWRNKRPTFHRWGDSNAANADVQNTYSNMDAIRDGFSLRNPAYDLFVGQTGRKRGFLGYTLNQNLDQDNDVDVPSSEKYLGPNSGTLDLQNTTPFYDTTARAHPLDEQALTVDDLLTIRLNRDDYVIMKDVRFFLGKEHGKSHFEDTLHWDWNDPIDTPTDNVLASPTLNNKNFRWNMTLIATSGGKHPVVLNECVRWTTKMTSG